MSSERPGIVFQVETGRILEILATEIYDSPHALLRENVQNAYDAILMRVEAFGFNLEDGRIDIGLSENLLTIRDNGVGMTEEVLRENFWKAGSSGKRTDAARRAGVVGTFGIGAMANFGVARRIVVQTRMAEQGTILKSSADRESLSIQEECIRLEEVTEEFDPGTLVTVELDSENQITFGDAVGYLSSYVRFLPVPVYFNDQLLSQASWEIPNLGALDEIGSGDIHENEFTVQYEIASYEEGRKILVRLQSVTWLGFESGDGYLLQQTPPLMGLRNHFGLAPIPSTGHYAFGGVINAPFLQPTAGREALSRESIQRVATLLTRIEQAVSATLSSNPQADRNSSFLNHAARGPVDWARHVRIRIAPSDDRIALQDLPQRTDKFYGGSDQAAIQMFASAESPLAVLDSANPRRRLQARYIDQVLHLEAIPDQPTVLKEYDPSELRLDETTFLIVCTRVLIEEYLVGDVEVLLADLSHSVPLLPVRGEDGVLQIYLSRDHPQLGAVLEALSTAGEAFSAFVRDFVRMNIYGAISIHVPSATREGAEALLAQVRRNRELYRYDEQDLGSIGALLEDLLSAEGSIGDVIRRAGRRARAHSQSVTSGQVGSVETVVPDVVHDNFARPVSLDPSPPILRPELDTQMKILTSDTAHPSLNGFRMLLGLSEKVSRRERPFFEAPHQTRVLWAQHRIVYVFTHASGELSLYYDIEMPSSIVVEGQGGLHLPTTTLITNRRIFVPVPDELRESFDPAGGEKRFHVRFDTVTNDGQANSE